jgi:hypothetical protein
MNEDEDFEYELHVLNQLTAMEEKRERKRAVEAQRQNPSEEGALQSFANACAGAGITAEEFSNWFDGLDRGQRKCGKDVQGLSATQYIIDDSLLAKLEEGDKAYRALQEKVDGETRLKIARDENEDAPWLEKWAKKIGKTKISVPSMPLMLPEEINDASDKTKLEWLEKNMGKLRRMKGAPLCFDEEGYITGERYSVWQGYLNDVSNESRDGGVFIRIKLWGPGPFVTVKEYAYPNPIFEEDV